MPHVCECGGVVRSTPVAQTLVLRRVLTGGISADSGRVVFFLAQYGSSFEGVLERRGWGLGGLVFGTLLGPEATGPGGAAALAVVFSGTLFLVFLAPPIMHVWPLLWGCVWGVVYGVVV